MSTSTPSAPAQRQPHRLSTSRADWRNDAAFQSFTVLRIGFTVLPIVFGADKFANILVNWESYLAPWIDRIVPGSATVDMRIVGVIEILAGLLVAVKPKYGALVVALWLAGIVVNLLTYSGYYDVALRDFGLLLGAVTLARLAMLFDKGASSGKA